MSAHTSLCVALPPFGYALHLNAVLSLPSHRAASSGAMYVHESDGDRVAQFELDVKCVKLPAHSPNLNAYAERFVLSIRSECLDKLVPLGERHLRLAVSEYVEHYHLERNHQGLDGRLLTDVPMASESGKGDGSSVTRRQRLGGLLNYFHRIDERLAA